MLAWGLAGSGVAETVTGVGVLVGVTGVAVFPAGWVGVRVGLWVRVRVGVRDLRERSSSAEAGFTSSMLNENKTSVTPINMISFFILFSVSFRKNYR